MGKASAIPEHLYHYSERCTQGAQQVQDWVRTALSPALRAYEQGGGQCLVAIDHDVAVQVATAYYTDRGVRSTGEAFFAAGSVGDINAPEGRTQERKTSFRYEIPDDALEAYQKNKARMDAGGALAKRLRGRDLIGVESITEQLSHHADDPYFCAGFFNALNASEIAHLIGKRGECSVLGNDDALINALASGAASRQTADNLQRVLGWVSNGSPFDVAHYHITAGQQLAFVNALSKNPTACRNLVDLLTSKQLGELMTNGQSFADDGRSKPHFEVYFYRMLDVLRAAQATYRDDPVGMHEFMLKAGPAMEGVWLHRMPGSVDILMQFISIGIVGSLRVPEGRLDPGEIKIWAGTEGPRMDRILAGFLMAFMKMNERIPDTAGLLRGVLVGEAIEFLPFGKFIRTGSQVVDDAVIAAIGSMLGPAIEAKVKKELGDEKKGTLDVKTFLRTSYQGYGEILLFTQLVAQGAVRDKEGVIVKFGPDKTENAHLLESLSESGDSYTIGDERYLTVKDIQNRFEEALKVTNQDGTSSPAVLTKKPSE